MRTDTLGNWPEQLQPVVLASNTHLKLATGYTPFYLMFRRERDAEKLLKLAKHANDTGPADPQPLTEANNDIITNKDVIADGADSGKKTDKDDPYMFVNNTSEWAHDQLNERKESIVIAKKRIEKDQLRQKNIYDKKVKLNR